MFQQLLLAMLSCILAFVGGLVGCITGAATSQTTETGFLRGCGVGTISGSLVAHELAESIINHNFLSKVGISSGPVDGEVFTDWLTRVLLKAYDFQVNNLLDLPVMSDLSDIFDAETGVKGLSLEYLSNLPTFKVPSRLGQCREDDGVSCPVWLKNLLIRTKRRGMCKKADRLPT